MRLILALAAAGLALATLFALSARLWWAFDLFSHFRLQYLVLALAFGLLALVLRLYPLAAIFALIACVHGFALKDLWLGGDAGMGAEGEALRVASANVLKGNPSPQAVREFVRTADPDVLVLVEAEGERWRGVLASIAEDYPDRAPAGWQDGGPVVLFSRPPIVRDSVLEPPAGRRPYLLAELALAGQTLSVVGVHPSSPSPRDPSETRRRNLQLDYLADLIEGRRGPIVLAGDFNTTPWSPYFQDLLAEAGLRPAAYGHGYIGTWPAWLRPALIPIDHILIKGPIAVTDVRAGAPTGSDHYPIVADLRIAASAAASSEGSGRLPGVAAFFR